VTALGLRSGQVADAADFEIEPQGSSAKAPGVVDVVLTGQAVAVILGLVRATMRGADVRVEDQPRRGEHSCAVFTVEAAQ
jgi:hypothetical protein